MSKQEVSYIGLVSQVLKQARKDAETAGKVFNQKEAMQSAASRWKVVKAGNDPEFVPGKSAPTRKANKGSKPVPLPGHKGAPSKTRPGHLDFVTHKGDKYYNRDGHRETTNAAGVEGRPYARKAKTAQVVMELVELCHDCKSKVEALIASPAKKAHRKTRRRRAKKE
jgi:hypothetical protein